MTFADKLKSLRERATPGPWEFFYKRKYDEWHVSVPMTGGGMKLALFEHGIPTKNGDDAELIAFLANHATEIEALVRAAKEVDRIGIGAHLQLHEALEALDK